MSRLSEAVNLYCKVNSISRRDIVAELDGISFSTVHRFLAGKTVDADHFMKILTWLLAAQQKEKQ